VIEVLEHAEPIHLREVRIGLVLRDRSRDLDRGLLEADRRLERRLIRRVQPVDELLLLVLDSAHARERQPELAVHPRACVAESDRFRFDAVHQDHADARERVVIELAVWLASEVAPGEHLTVERNAFLVAKI